MFLSTTDQSGAPLCACTLIKAAHTGVDKLCLQFDVFHVFIDIFRRRIRFYHENIEFPFLELCESAGELSGTILPSLEALRRNSGHSRACLKLSWSLFWVPGEGQA